MEYNSTWTYKNGQWFNKEWNLADKKSSWEDTAQWKKKWERLEKDLAALF